MGWGWFIRILELGFAKSVFHRAGARDAGRETIGRFQV